MTREIYAAELLISFQSLDSQLQQELCKYIDMYNFNKINRPHLLEAILKVERNSSELLKLVCKDFTSGKNWRLFSDAAYNYRPGNMGL